MVVELFFLGWMIRYLWKETARRGLGWRHWLHRQLPPSMDFAVAVVVFDGGVWLRSLTIWAWRRFFEASDFSVVQIGLLAAGAAAIVIGSLCKIRSVTIDYGPGPWMLAAGALAVFVGATLYFR